MAGTFGAMIPVLNAEQVRKADAHTIAQEPIASIDLMERAAQRCVDRLNERHVPAGAHYLVLAGCGNNGGDGLAIARLLAEAGASVRVGLCRYRPQLSPDAETNRQQLVQTGVPLEEHTPGTIPAVPLEHEVVIDALLGTGLDRPLDGWLKQVVAEVNRWPNEVIAIDMPSGLFAEDNGQNDPKAIVQADLVLTLEVPKLALLLPENGPYVGTWQRVPIGLDPAFLHGLASKHLLVETSDVHPLMPARPRTAHKGTFGHALLVAGGPGKVGAAILAARACARSGAGLISVRVPPDLQSTIQVSLPEAMTVEDIFDKRTAAAYNAVGIGPGIGRGADEARMLKRLIQEAPAPLVIDADALNLVSENPTWLAFLPKRTVLTPHPKEFDRLAGPSSTGFERLAKARDFAIRFGVVLVLKGAHTAICSPDGTVYFNPTGNVGMAKGGSGDALTGVITALLAQGLEPVTAAVLGVFAHGSAGDRAAQELGIDGLLPSDVIGHLPLIWSGIRASS